MEQSLKPEEIKMRLQFSLIKLFMLYFFMIYLLNIITFPCVTAQTSNDLISEICRKTKTPNLCSKILRSNHKALKASSPLQLGEVSIDLIKSRAQSTKNTINALSARTRDPRLKEGLKSCLTNYDSAIHYIKTAIHYWKGGDFVNVAKYIAAAVNEPIHCQQNFAKGPAEPADVREGNHNLETLCRVVLVISNQLSGRMFSAPEVRSSSQKVERG